MNNQDKLNPPEALNRKHDRAAFDCGVVPLNEYLQKYAWQNQRKNSARTYVATRGNRIVGYYSLAFGSITPDEATPAISAGLGRYPIPVVLLARLAVDTGEKGQGLGTGLLRDALRRALQASEIAGLRAVLVHAKDDAAKAFYEKFDFEPSPLNEYHLLLPVSEIIEHSEK